MRLLAVVECEVVISLAVNLFSESRILLERPSLSKGSYAKGSSVSLGS